MNDVILAVIIGVVLGAVVSVFVIRVMISLERIEDTFEEWERKGYLNKNKPPLE